MEIYLQLRKDFLILAAAITLSAAILDYLQVGLGPTDNKEDNVRSGLHYYKDHGTGVEYVGNGTMFMVRPK